MNSMSNASIFNRGQNRIHNSAAITKRNRVSVEDIRDGGNMFCGLCFEKYIQNDTIIEISTCKHYFHQQCLLSWFADYDECPVCQIKV